VGIQGLVNGAGWGYFKKIVYLIKHLERFQTKKKNFNHNIRSLGRVAYRVLEYIYHYTNSHPTPLQMLQVTISAILISNLYIESNQYIFKKDLIVVRVQNVIFSLGYQSLRMNKYFRMSLSVREDSGLVLTNNVAKEQYCIVPWGHESCVVGYMI
jgi:hypothetical protein